MQNLSALMIHLDCFTELCFFMRILKIKYQEFDYRQHSELGGGFKIKMPVEVSGFKSVPPGADSWSPDNPSNHHQTVNGVIIVISLFHEI